MIEQTRKLLLKKLPVIGYDESYFVTQFHYPSADGETNRRIRKEIHEYGTEFYEVHKTPTGRGGVYVTTTRTLTEEEYNGLIADAVSVIVKTRHIIYEGMTKWEMDEYHNVTLVTAELKGSFTVLDHVTDDIHATPVPAFFADSVIMDVTGIQAFTNGGLSVKK